MFEAPKRCRIAWRPSKRGAAGSSGHTPKYENSGYLLFQQLFSSATKKLQRGISRANCALVDLSRKRVTEDEHDHAHYLVDTPMYTFILPDLAMYPVEFRAFMEKDLLEMATLANLEHTGTCTFRF